MNIVCKVIPESQMRPQVSGADWFFDKKGDLQVRVSPMSDWRYEVALMLHELFEAILWKQRHGTSVSEVDRFDQLYYETHEDDLDAGDERGCPYRKEHCLATAAERILSAELGIVWIEYDEELATAYPGPAAVRKAKAKGNRVRPQTSARKPKARP